MSGPWFAVNAGFVDGPRERKLYDRWGWCGVVLWLAFTAACKRSPIEGQVAYRSDEQLAAELGIHGRPLYDRDGKPFTLREFFQWTGLRRWTLFRRRTWPAIVYRGWEAHQQYRVYPRRAQPRRTPPPPPPNPAQQPSSEGESVDAPLTDDVPDTGGTTTGGTSTHQASDDDSAGSVVVARADDSASDQDQADDGPPFKVPDAVWTVLGRSIPAGDSDPGTVEANRTRQLAALERVHPDEFEGSA